MSKKSIGGTWVPAPEAEYCPKCGAVPLLFQEQADYFGNGWMRIECPRCAHVGSFEKTRADAVAIWDKRALSPPATEDAKPC